jgi:aldose 1-epimerase
MSAHAAQQWTLSQGDLTVTVSPRGGSIVQVAWRGTSILLPAGGPEGAAACFPTVPFGNRIAGNCFSFRGESFLLQPNTDEPLVLHGDGWLDTWDLAGRTGNAIELDLVRKQSSRSPYVFQAHQKVHLEEGGLSLSLRVKNLGDAALPFGIGFHPFFRRTPDMTLQTRVRDMWREGEGHLPDGRQDIPKELDFSTPQGIPSRWINNAFGGFAGKARLLWPDIDLALDLNCDPVFDVMMIYAPQARTDFVCLEPMSHLPNGHNLPDLGGLSVLEPGEELAGTIRMTVRHMPRNGEKNDG